MNNGEKVCEKWWVRCCGVSHQSPGDPAVPAGVTLSDISYSRLTGSSNWLNRLHDTKSSLHIVDLWLPVDEKRQRHSLS